MREFFDEPIPNAKGLHVAKRPKKVAPLDPVDVIVLFRRLTMHFMFKSELLHWREHLAKRIANLCYGRYLRVELPAINRYEKGVHIGFTEKYPHFNFLSLEPDLVIVEPEVLCCVHKLRETRNGKCELLEESNAQDFEARGRNPANNRFQVSANASEPEQAKLRKCDVCRDWCMYELPLHMVGKRECKGDREILQLGHE